MALVDDCIIRHFHPKPARQLLIPIPKFRMDMEYVGTKRLFNDVLGRPTTRGSPSTRRPTPLHKASCEI